jgi:hypothetical protein
LAREVACVFDSQNRQETWRHGDLYISGPGIDFGESAAEMAALRLGRLRNWYRSRGEVEVKTKDEGQCGL